MNDPHVPQLASERPRRWALRRQSLGVATMSCLLVGVLASPAQAASYNISGPVPGQPGSGYSSGDVTFTGAKKFDWIGEIDDICPEDGRGMELQFGIRYVGGATFQRQDVIQDLRTCPPGPLVVTYPLSYTMPLQIKELRIELWATQGGSAYVRIAESNWKDNPYT
jgi:hypothetical protein